MVHYNFAYPNHVVVDLYGIDEKKADDLDNVCKFSDEISELIHSQIIKQYFKRLNPGLIYIAVLMQSHIAYHSWPEVNYASLDIYACSDVPVSKTLNTIYDYFRPRKMEITLLSRKIPTFYRAQI